MTLREHQPAGPAGRHALVVGGGIGGLLAGLGLRRRFSRVTIVERDRWPATPAPRRGAPQGRCLHILAAEGDSQWVMFPGNYQEYEADKVKRLGEEGAKPHRLRFKALK